MLAVGRDFPISLQYQNNAAAAQPMQMSINIGR